MSLEDAVDIIQGLIKLQKNAKKGDKVEICNKMKLEWSKLEDLAREEVNSFDIDTEKIFTSPLISKKQIKRCNFDSKYHVLIIRKSASMTLEEAKEELQFQKDIHKSKLFENYTFKIVRNDEFKELVV